MHRIDEEQLHALRRDPEAMGLKLIELEGYLDALTPALQWRVRYEIPLRNSPYLDVLHIEMEMRPPNPEKEFGPIWLRQVLSWRWPSHYLLLPYDEIATLLQDHAAKHIIKTLFPKTRGH